MSYSFLPSFNRWQTLWKRGDSFECFANFLDLLWKLTLPYLSYIFDRTSPLSFFFFPLGAYSIHWIFKPQLQLFENRRFSDTRLIVERKKSFERKNLSVSIKVSNAICSFSFFLERETNLAFPKWDRISLFPFNRVLIFIFYFPQSIFRPWNVKQFHLPPPRINPSSYFFRIIVLQKGASILSSRVTRIEYDSRCFSIASSKGWEKRFTTTSVTVYSA